MLEVLSDGFWLRARGGLEELEKLGSLDEVIFVYIVGLKHIDYTLIVLGRHLSRATLNELRAGGLGHLPIFVRVDVKPFIEDLESFLGELALLVYQRCIWNIFNNQKLL